MVTSGNIGSQSPRARDPMPPLGSPSTMLFSRYEMDLNRYETVQKFNESAF